MTEYCEKFNNRSPISQNLGAKVASVVDAHNKLRDFERRADNQYESGTSPMKPQPSSLQSKTASAFG